MHLPPPFIRPQLPTEPPALVHVVSAREDVLWNRPVFKAPPLNVRPPVIDLAGFTSSPVQIGRLGS